MTTTPQGFPQISAPFVDPKTGQINQAWYQLIIALWNRTGGGQGVAGSLTSFSCTSHDGIVSVVTDADSTPNLDLTLTDITPDSVAASGTVTGSNLSGTNTGDQTITLTGDVTGTGTGSFATMIGTGKVTSTMLASGAAAANVGSLGGDLSGTLPNPTLAANVPHTDAANTFTVAPQTISIDDAAHVGLIVKGHSSQTANLVDYENSSSTVLSGVDASGNFATLEAGVGFQVWEGMNARMGVGSLSGGTVTVGNTGITSVTRIFLTANANISNPGALYVSGRTPGTDFTVTSTNASDASTFAYLLIEPTFALESMKFTAASSMSMSMTGANFGTGWDTKLNTWSFWVKRASTGAQVIYLWEYNPSGLIMELYFDSSNRITFQVSTGAGAGSATGSLVTTATYTSTTAWLNIVAVFDSANATSTDRLRLYVNGTRITLFDSTLFPALNADLITNLLHVYIGRDTAGSYFNGKVYQPAFFNGVAVATNQIINAGGHPLDITGISGLYSLLETNSIDAITKDYVLSPAWTNNNTVVKDVGIPT